MICFTGMTGTSGSALIEVMKKNNYSEEFRVIVRNRAILDELADGKLNYTSYIGDITDEKFLVHSFEGVDVVFHIAAKGYIRQIATAVVNAKTVKHCIVVSSTSIYSNHHTSSQKVLESEKYMKDLFQKHDIELTIIRPTMIYGTLKDGNISTFIKWFDKFRVFPIVGNGKALLQPVHRKDLASAYYLIMKNLDKVKGKEYVVSGDRPISLRELFNLILDCLGKKTIFINVPFGLANFLVKFAYKICKIDYREQILRLNENRAFNCFNIKNDLGYVPKPIEFWIKNLVNEYRGAL